MARKIFVNGREFQTVTDAVSYSLIVELAGGKPTERDYTVLYRRAPNNEHGSLTPGNIMDVCDGTIFTIGVP